jgi:hypothetical protein
MKVDNENEPDTMLPISVVALAILNRLRTTMQLRDLEREEKQSEHREPQSESGRDDEREGDKHGQHVD